jgi:hypothetical protein
MALPTASDNQFPKVILEEVANDGSATTTPAADHRALFLGEDGSLHLKDSAAAVTDIGGSAAHEADAADAHDASAISVLDTATNFTGTDVEAVLAELQDNIDAVSGGSFTGQPIAVTPVAPLGAPTNATNNTADLAFATPILVPGPMKVTGLLIHVGTSNTGQVQWGLFEYTSNPAAATKLAGGTQAPGGTGDRLFAATSAPVDVAAGAYMIVVKQPAANVPTLSVQLGAGSVTAWNQIWTTYTWDDTPDFTSASWATNGNILRMALVGNMDATNAWG